MVKTTPCLILCILLFVCSCKSIHEIEQLLYDTYRITEAQYRQMGGEPTGQGRRSLTADVLQSDSAIIITAEFENTRPLKLKLDEINSLKMYRYTFDIDVLTVPFKIRPAVSGFPEQLNANFDAALYFGRRRDSYTIEKKKKGRTEFTRIHG